MVWSTRFSKGLHAIIFDNDNRFISMDRSASPPDDVNRLRPGDIDIVGGLGDSLVAGSGALEEFAIGTFIEARGVSWCAGGQGNWRKFLTLPNLIKVHIFKYLQIPRDHSIIIDHLKFFSFFHLFSFFDLTIIFSIMTADRFLSRL